MRRLICPHWSHKSHCRFCRELAHISFMNSCLIRSIPSPLWKWVYSFMKELFNLGATSFPIECPLFQNKQKQFWQSLLNIAISLILVQNNDCNGTRHLKLRNCVFVAYGNSECLDMSAHPCSWLGSLLSLMKLMDHMAILKSMDYMNILKSMDHMNILKSMAHTKYINV